MSADDYVRLAVFRVFKRLCYLFFSPESVEKLYLQSETFEPLFCRFVMLRSEYRRRSEYDCLLGFHHGLEHRAESDLSLAVTHVAAKKPVHDHAFFHIRFYFSGRLELVGSLFVRESVLEPLLFGGVGRINVSFRLMPRRVKLNEVYRHLLYRLLDLFFRLFEVLAAQLRQLGHTVASRISAQPVHLVDGHLQKSAFGVFDDNVIAFYVAVFDAFGTYTATYTVYLVYDVIADFGQREYTRFGRFVPYAAAFEKVSFTYDDESVGRITETVLHLKRGNEKGVLPLFDLVRVSRRHAFLIQTVCETLSRSWIAHAGNDAVSRRHVVFDVGMELSDIVSIVFDRNRPGAVKRRRGIYYPVCRRYLRRAYLAEIFELFYYAIRCNERAQVFFEHLAVLSEVFNSVRRFPFEKTHLFVDRSRLVQKYRRVIGKIVGKHGHLVLYERKQPLERLIGDPARLEFRRYFRRALSCSRGKFRYPYLSGFEGVFEILVVNKKIVDGIYRDRLYGRDRRHRIRIVRFYILDRISEK